MSGEIFLTVGGKTYNVRLMGRVIRQSVTQLCMSNRWYTLD